jgi:hypothetical protein
MSEKLSTERVAYIEDISRKAMVKTLASRSDLFVIFKTSAEMNALHARKVLEPAVKSNHSELIKSSVALVKLRNIVCAYGGCDLEAQVALELPQNGRYFRLFNATTDVENGVRDMPQVKHVGPYAGAKSAVFRDNVAVFFKEKILRWGAS